MLKTEGEAQGFQHLPNDLANALKNVLSFSLHEFSRIFSKFAKIWHCILSMFDIQCLSAPIYFY